MGQKAPPAALAMGPGNNIHTQHPTPTAVPPQIGGVHPWEAQSHSHYFGCWRPEFTFCRALALLLRLWIIACVRTAFLQVFIDISYLPLPWVRTACLYNLEKNLRQHTTPFPFCKPPNTPSSSVPFSYKHWLFRVSTVTWGGPSPSPTRCSWMLHRHRSKKKQPGAEPGSSNLFLTRWVCWET